VKFTKSQKIFFLDFDGKFKYSRKRHWSFGRWQCANHWISWHKLVFATAIKEPSCQSYTKPQLTPDGTLLLCFTSTFISNAKFQDRLRRVAVFAECKPVSIGGKNWLSAKRTSTWPMAGGTSSLWTGALETLPFFRYVVCPTSKCSNAHVLGHLLSLVSFQEEWLNFVSV
jgi:hypothetical protein